MRNNHRQAIFGHAVETLGRINATLIQNPNLNCPRSVHYVLMLNSKNSATICDDPFRVITFLDWVANYDTNRFAIRTYHYPS